MDEEVTKKIDEIAKKYGEEKKVEKLAKKQEEDEKLRSDREFQQEKENLLNEIKKELDEFEPKLFPLRHAMYDKREFYRISNIECTIVATKDKRIGISGSYPNMLIGGYPSIFYLANVSELQPYILEILRFFLSGLKQFEKYYADNVEKYLR